MERLPENIRRFMSNIKDGRLHNIYYIRSVDKDGNITSEAYGKNLLTDYGLRRITSSIGDHPDHVYISSNNTTPALSDTTMTNLFTTSDPANSKTSSEEYDIEYDSNTGIASQTKFFKEVYWDYNYSGITTDFDAYSLGLFENAYTGYPNSMMYHTLIYDINGDPTHITKRPNERLYLSIYLTAIMNTSIIDDLATNNDFHVLMTPEFFFGGQYKRLELVPATATDTDVGSYNYDAILTDLMNFTDSTVTNHTATQTKTANTSRVYESEYDSVVGLINGDPNSYCVGYKFNMSLPSPETVSTDFAQVDDITSDVFDSMFGGRAIIERYAVKPTNSNECVLPVSDFTISGLKRYNYSTRAWDTNVPYTSGTLINKKYNVGRIRLNNFKIGYPGVGNVTVYMNPRPDLELVGFTVDNNSSSYVPRYAMTDDYFDKDSYVEILDISNIDNALRHKKYIISLNGSYDIKFNYINPNPITLNLSAPRNATITIDPSEITGLSLSPYNELLATSDVNDWIACSSFVVFNPEDSANRSVVELPTTDLSTAYDGMLYATDDSIVRFGVKNIIYSNAVNTMRIYDVTDPALPYNDIDFNEVYTTANLSVSFSKHGYICIYVKSGNSAIIVDIDDANHSSPSIIDTISTDICMMGEDSDYFVYHDTSVANATDIVVYDCSTQQEVDRFTLPTHLTYTLNGIFVWKSHIYIQYTDSQSVSNTYYYDVNDQSQQLVSLNATYPFLSKWNEQPCAYTSSYDQDDERHYASSTNVCIIGTVGVPGTQPRVLVDDKTRNTYNILTFGDEITKSDLSDHAASAVRIPYSKYTTDGKTLMCGGYHIYVNPGSYNRSIGSYAYDLGAMIDKDFVQNRIVYGQNGFVNLYKDYVVDINVTTRTIRLVPFERYIKLQMTGTTNTITSYNNPFKLDYGQAFTATITNDMDRIINPT